MFVSKLFLIISKSMSYIYTINLVDLQYAIRAAAVPVYETQMSLGRYIPISHTTWMMERTDPALSYRFVSSFISR